MDNGSLAVEITLKNILAEICLNSEKKTNESNKLKLKYSGKNTLNNVINTC